MPFADTLAVAILIVLLIKGCENTAFSTECVVVGALSIANFPFSQADPVTVLVVFVKVLRLNARRTKSGLTELVVVGTGIVTRLPFSLAGGIAGPVIPFVGSIHYAPGPTVYIPVPTDSVTRCAFALADSVTFRVVSVIISAEDAILAALFVTTAARSIALLPLALTAIATGPHPAAPILGNAVLATLNPVGGTGPVTVDLQAPLLEQAGAVAVRKPGQTTPVRRFAAFF